MLHTMRQSTVTNHYTYLERVLPDFFGAVGLTWEHYAGIIGAHGDKCYSYRSQIELAGMTFGQGVALYMLTYCEPFASESRQTESGWVDPIDWIVENKDRFLPLLPE